MANNIIVLNRGDTRTFDLTIRDENSVGGRYILRNDDALYLGIMDPHQPFEHALVKKKIVVGDDCIDENGNITITILPSDTIDLYPGVYYYAVKLHKHSDTDEEYIDEVTTIINKTKFVIND